MCPETVCLSECLFSGAFALRGRFQRRDAHVGGERGDSCAYVLRKPGQSSLVVHVACVTHQLHESRRPAVRTASAHQGEPPEVPVQPQQHQHCHAPTLPRQTLPWLRKYLPQCVQRLWAHCNYSLPIFHLIFTGTKCSQTRCMVYFFVAPKDEQTALQGKNGCFLFTAV